jgi:hypothetical protein
VRAIFAIVVASTACGRIGFDAVADSPDADAVGGGADAQAVTPCPAWTPFEPPTLVENLSSGAHWLGGLSDDEQLVFFADWKADTQNDLRVASRSSATALFEPSIELTELNSVNQEQKPMSRDGLLLFFAQDTGGFTEIVTAERADRSSAFGPITVLTELNSPRNDSPGWISRDGLRFYLSSNRDVNKYEIYYAERTSPSLPFSTPVLVSELSSPERDASPTLSVDELEILYASDRATPGRYDIWRATRTSRDEPFDPPQPVPELNTVEDDVLPHLSIDGSRLYYVYDTRLEGGRSSDVWLTERDCLP